MAGIRLEFAQFGHFDSFDVIRSLTSMAGLQDHELPVPIAAGLTTMFYVDTDVIEGSTYYYRVRVWRGYASFLSDEIQVFAIVPYAAIYLELEADFIDRGLHPLVFANNGVSIGNRKSIFNGSQYLQSTTKSADFAFGTQPFTMEVVASMPDGGGGTLLDMRDVYQNSSANLDMHYANLVVVNPTNIGWSNGSVFHSAAYTFTPGIEYALAITRDSLNKLRFFVNGQKIFETTDMTNISGDRYFHIGVARLQNGKMEGGFKGTVRRVRITKGEAKYIENYTVTYQK